MSRPHGHTPTFVLPTTAARTAPGIWGGVVGLGVQMDSTGLAKASKVGVPQEDKRTSSFSCQACKVKKVDHQPLASCSNSSCQVKCSRTFPCDNCVKLKIDCVPQSRKRCLSQTATIGSAGCCCGCPSRCPVFLVVCLSHLMSGPLASLSDGLGRMKGGGRALAVRTARPLSSLVSTPG